MNVHRIAAQRFSEAGLVVRGAGDKKEVAPCAYD
jgi:hypothetical protein